MKDVIKRAFEIARTQQREDRNRGLRLLKDDLREFRRARKTLRDEGPDAMLSKHGGLIREYDKLTGKGFVFSPYLSPYLGYGWYQLR